MKIIFIFFLILSYLHGGSSNDNYSRSCYEIIHEIDLLEEEKTDELATNVGKVATFLLTGNLIVSDSNKEINMKIKILKLELATCY